MSQGYGNEYIVKATGETAIWKHLTEQNGPTGLDDDVNFTLPSGINCFKVIFEDVETSSSTDNIRIQLGDSGGLQTTGYNGGSHNFNTATVSGNSGTTAVQLNRTVSTETFSGVVEFVRMSPGSHKWMWHGIIGSSVSNDEIITSGFVELTNELTTVSCQTSTTNTWQSTSGFNILYENPDLAISGNDSVPAGVTHVFENGTLIASTSGTEIDFSPPSGVKEVVLMLTGVSQSTTSQAMIVQLGDSGGIETTGYVGSGTLVAGATTASTLYTKGMGIRCNSASILVNGIVTCRLVDEATNLWQMTFTGGADITTATNYTSSAYVTLDSELTTIRLTTDNGTDTFDNGNVNVSWENQELDLGSGVISGGVIQTINSQDGAMATTTTTMPNDDTIPQNTEGGEFLTASITPNSTANKLRIDVVLTYYGTVGSYTSVALFQDSTAGALGSVMNHEVAGGMTTSTFTYWMDAGTTDSTTFKVRAGMNNAGTLTVNGIAGTRRHGGVMTSSITVTEYKA